MTMAAAADLFSLEPTASARAAGLRHVDPETLPGFTRSAPAIDAGPRPPPVRRGKPPAFTYVDARGQRVRDPATLERIRRLAIPPAWTQVWICPIADGHIQAVGRDARGRRQYRYHARWREVRDATKYHKMLAFAEALPRIRAACRRSLASRGLPREKVLATAVRILELTHIRVGHEEYTRENGSYGLTTLRDRHVRIEGADVRLHFRGKAGKMRDVGVHDRQLARIVRECTELPGHKYRAHDGTLHTIDSGDVNEYLARISGGDFTAKDFRTWAGTVMAARTLHALEPCLARARANKNVALCIRTVASRLGNTPAVCKKCYVHPAIVDAYLDGSLRAVPARSDEALVRAVLARAGKAGDEAKLTRALTASVRLAARVRRGVGTRRDPTRTTRARGDSRHEARPSRPSRSAARLRTRRETSPRKRYPRRAG